MHEMRNAYKVLLGNPERKTLFRETYVDLKKIGLDNEDVCLLGCSDVHTNNPEDSRLSTYRRENLKSEGWIMLAGLSWLKTGTVGAFENMEMNLSAP
jgi:hypothetical protein